MNLLTNNEPGSYNKLLFEQHFNRLVTVDGNLGKE